MVKLYFKTNKSIYHVDVCLYIVYYVFCTCFRTLFVILALLKVSTRDICLNGCFCFKQTMECTK